MPPKHDPKKAEAERLSGFLQELLREEENKYCADCEAKQPRWASWNLGVFLCIRCAGLHRNLGVHISKVKSVNLDSWTPEQVQSMRVMGNAKAKAVYEAELPHMFRRPQSDQTLEAFIRAKYEARRYILRDWQAPPVNTADLPKRAGVDNAKSESLKAKTTTNSLPIPKVSPKPHETQQAIQQAAVPTQSALLIDLSAPTDPTPAPTALDSSIFAQPQSNDLIATSQTTTGDLDDFLYGPVVSAPSVNSSKESGNINNNMTKKKKSKDDIMALFRNSQPTMAVENGMAHAFGTVMQQPMVFPPSMGFDASQGKPPTAHNCAPMPSGNMNTPVFLNTGAPAPTSGASGLDDLLGQFKL